MSSDSKAKIEKVIRTLDRVTVNGKDNMDMLLGCILTLERILVDEAPGKEETENA